MLHKILTERREIGDSSFLARMLFSRRTMSRSMILRITSNGFGSPAEPEIFSTGEKKIKKVQKTYLDSKPCDIYIQRRKQ